MEDEKMKEEKIEINNTNISVSLINIFKKFNKNYNSNKEFLKFHQYITEQYMIRMKDLRGMLIFYDTGMGKTFLAVALAEYYRLLDPNRKIIILSAKSLAKNFHNSILNYMIDIKKIDENEANNIIENKYRFVSSNASNMPIQLQNIRREKKNVEIEKTIGRIVETERKFGFLENSLIIVDEAHNVFNSITNGSKNGILFYDMIMNAKNIKLLFLSGTPIINDPFELVPCFNMLIGKIGGKIFFPEIQEDFENWFVDREKLEIKNKDKLSNYLLGRVSYYGSFFTEDNEKKSKENFPTEFPIIVQEISMSMYQYNVYSTARSKEKLEKSSNKRGGLESNNIKRGGFEGRFSVDEKKTSSTYRVKTRQISNFALPKILREEIDKKTEEISKMKDKIIAHKLRKNLKKEIINKLSENDLSLKKLEKYSPKMLKIINNIKNEIEKGKSIGMVYSEFVTGEGLGIFEKILISLGWEKFSTKSYIKTGGLLNQNEDFYKTLNDVFGGVKSKKKKKENKIFAIISGDVDPEDRSIIVNALNANKNINGNLISLLLLSSTGAEGLDLKGIRHIHIMEPYWNLARINQVKARGIRFMSHSHLPKKEQNVTAYLYLSTYPKEIISKKKLEPTTDVYIYNNAMKNQIIIDKFLLLLIETSVDCFIHRDKADKNVQKKIHCKICRPTNKPLYYNILSEDINMKNDCIDVDEIVDAVSDETPAIGPAGKASTKDAKSSKSSLSSNITAKELILDGNIKIYYSVDPKKEGEKLLNRIHIYEYKPLLEGYSKMEEDNPLFANIMNKIMKIEK